jgi:outer membrane protein OmpA-like peptidoglycan-associated protein
MKKFVFNLIIPFFIIALFGFTVSPEKKSPTEFKPTYIYFNTNSILSCNDSLNQVDSIRVKTFDYACNEMITILKENPTITIEIVGHASTQEKNHQLLSLYRAQLIKEILVAKVINPKHIKTVGWGNHKLLIKDDFIKKAKTNEEKQSLHLKNQRAYFRVIDWDFKE